MSDAQLQELATRAKQAMHDRFASRVEELRVYGRELGFEVTISRIGESSPRRGRPRKTAEIGDPDDRKASVAPKFRNPDNSAQTWSGRGRAPLWYKDKIAAGASQESLLISPKGQG